MMERVLRDLRPQGSPDRSCRGCLAYAVAALVAAGALLGGCASQPYRTEQRLERGLVIVLPGIEGRGPLNEAICEGLDEGGVNWAIELYDWTSPLGPMYNLRAEGDNRRKAGELGVRIARYRWRYPGRPVVLVGQSGGAAIAVWAAEALLPGQQIDGIIMLAASLSPTYRLEFALANVRRGIVNFYSSRDWVLLGMGTTVAGTMDGRHSSSAGQVGFEVPPAGRPNSYEGKLFQVAWEPEMTKAGHSGLHLTSGARHYVARYVAPFVLRAHWSDRLVGRILEGQWMEPFVPRAKDQRPSAPASRPASAPASKPAGWRK